MTGHVTVEIEVTVEDEEAFMAYAEARAFSQGCDAPTTLAQAAFLVFDLLEHERPKGCELYVKTIDEEGNTHSS